MLRESDGRILMLFEAHVGTRLLGLEVYDPAPEDDGDADGW